MATKKQIEANRRNSLKSTGPVTPEGKSASAKNAFKHGMYSADILLYHEDFEGYEVLRTQLLTDQEPETAGEFLLIEQVLQSSFMARRCLFMMADADNNAVHGGKPTIQTYPTLMKLKIQNDRIVQRALQTLREIKQQRDKAVSNSPETKVLPKIGFVPPVYPEAAGYLRQIPYTAPPPSDSQPRKAA